MRTVIVTALFSALLACTACQKPNPVMAERAGVYNFVLTNEQDAVIDAAQKAWEELRKKDPQRAATFPEPRLTVQGMSIELKENGQFIFNITNQGKPEVMLGTYEFREDKLVMTADSMNGKPAQSGQRVQEFNYDAQAKTIEIPGPNGPQIFRR
ncbi:MAG: hypothetical protein KF812_04125 [Fimbriimonadaceae bacterium]|nr:hypothetical protein [Fimbriimonadaceae bacterium]